VFDASEKRFEAKSSQPYSPESKYVRGMIFCDSEEDIDRDEQNPNPLFSLSPDASHKRKYATS